MCLCLSVTAPKLQMMRRLTFYLYSRQLDEPSAPRAVISCTGVGLYRRSAQKRCEPQSGNARERRDRAREDFSETYQGFDPNSSESYIIFELGQHRNMQQSIDFADLAQQELISTARTCRQRECVRPVSTVLWAAKCRQCLSNSILYAMPRQSAFLPRRKGGRSVPKHCSMLLKRIERIKTVYYE